jgi:single-stranded-DNA-specific exonuclease
MQKRWRILTSDPQAIRRICSESGCHPVMATILSNRGISEKNAVHEFLHPTINHINSYDQFADMAKAVQRISDAITRREKILIFGDYDVDGITSTVMLLDFLKNIGADVSHYIPHRVTEGYGLSKHHITDFAAPNHFGLVITVDCGSSSQAAVECANEMGIDVIITDHHAMPADAPKAFAIINPHRMDCPSDFKPLAGVGVVFYLIICLRKHLRDNDHWNEGTQPNLKEYCDLVALGTVADIVPMIKDNRVFTKIGLAVINSAPRLGIEALIKVSGINKPYIDAEDIAYRIGPRINSAGRMKHADLGVELILSKDLKKASDLAETLNNLNSLRQKEENVIFNEIEKFLDEEPEYLQRKTLVLCNENLHEGILGIVASRLTEKFYRPVILISFKDGIGKGSGRSIPGINIYNALEACAGLLEKFGGHPMAAGVRIRKDNYLRFKDAFEQSVEEKTRDMKIEPVINIDCRLELDSITDKLINEIELLQPFGPNNTEPLFLSGNVEVVFSKIVGRQHLRMMLKQTGKKENTRPLPAVWFHADSQAPKKRYFKEIVFKLRRNHWNGAQSIQAVIEDAR